MELESRLAMRGAMHAPQVTRTTSRRAIVGRHSADIPLFAALPGESRERLIRAGRVECFAAGATLFTEGENPEYFHAVLRGMVDISCTYQGRHCTALLMTPGDVFLPSAALSNEPYLVSARVLTPARIMLIDAAVVRAEMAGSAQFAVAIAHLLSGHWRMALRIILDLKCRSPSERLAAFLLRLHDARAPGTVAEIPFTKRQLAARVGMQPETLSRTLQVLAANGLHVRGREIIVSERAKVEAFCGPDPYPTGSDDDLGVHVL
jgi:CRP/FNR family transcriptional regulator, transcriptional activator FtrB